MVLILSGALAACTAWLYAGTAGGLVVEWITSADASYGLILTGAALVLAWRRRARLGRPVISLAASLGALLLIASGLVLYLAGLFAADLFATRVSMVVVAAGLLWFIGGAAIARAMALPLVLIAMAIPLPQIVVNAITLPLQLLASQLAEVMLTMAAVPVFRDGNVLELPSVTLQVVEACSGLRSVISLVSVAMLLAWMIDGPVVRRVLLVAAAVPIAVFMNGLRVAATGLASETWGAAATRGTWHTFTGWLTFALSLAVLLALERLLAERPRTASPAAVVLA